MTHAFKLIMTRKQTIKLRLPTQTSISLSVPSGHVNGHELLNYVFLGFFCRNASFSVFYQIKEALVRELSEKFCSEIDSLRQEVRVSVVMYFFIYPACRCFCPQIPSV